MEPKDPQDEEKKQDSSGSSKKKIENMVNKVKEDKRVNKCVDYAWAHRLEIFYAALMVIGILIAFYSIHIGGGLVGLATGLCFYDEMHNYVVGLREYYSQEGLFKTAMVIGVALYLLIALPSFLIAAAVGFAIIALIRWSSASKD